MIVVIGILAAITVVAYNGVQTRAINSARLSDMDTITKALEIYKVKHGNYPPRGDQTLVGWQSSAALPDGFLPHLKTSGIL